MKIIVTGGAGFIGSNLIRFLIKETENDILNIDALTYAGNLNSLLDVEKSDRYQFHNINICDKDALRKVIQDFKPNAVMHLAAESHVDRSIDGPGDFIQTNIFGTFNLLEACREYYTQLSSDEKTEFRFHHISTDEVYGDLEGTEDLFTEETPYNPSSPYSASKAGSDHLVRAWGRTYGLPVIITNCSNNYGPYHFPEKLIPHMILNALSEKALPVYGDGKQVRDWLFVEDHAKALYRVVSKGKIGETYNIGGHNEKMNIDVVNFICKELDELAPQFKKTISSYSDLITFVKDRPGHDVRYAIDSTKMQRELAWSPEETFETGMRKTIKWYLENEWWYSKILDGRYRLERVGEIK